MSIPDMGSRPKLSTLSKKDADGRGAAIQCWFLSCLTPQVSVKTSVARIADYQTSLPKLIVVFSKINTIHYREWNFTTLGKAPIY